MTTAPLRLGLVLAYPLRNCNVFDPIAYVPEYLGEGVKGYRLIALAFLGNSVWVGKNSRKSNSKSLKKIGTGYHSSTHAELDALLEVKRHLRPKVTLYVMRFRKDGTLAMARPCEECQQLFVDFEMSRLNVWYTDEDGQWQNLGKE